MVQVIAINRSETWVRPEPGPAINDYLLVVITLVLYFAIAYAHVWLGVWPFPSGLA